MKGLRFLTSLLTLLLLCSCSERVDRPTVSMLITQGFSESFYRSLAEDVRKDLGIDIEFVYENSSGQSAMLLQDFVHNDLKADIIFTFSKIPDRYLEDCCVDLASKSNLTRHYTYEALGEFMTEVGRAYQLPLSSRLVGITYNATLMREKGWKLPETYGDMLSLKKECDREGVPFAVTDIKYTGHAFNYLFNIMGSQWLSTVKGKAWMDGFLDGVKTLQVFKKNADYFRRWTEDGLFGELAGTATPALVQFGQRRALFCFSNRNNVYGYRGPMLDAEGNETGRMLDDEFKVMPWISEDGSNNCFTFSNNCWVMINRDLEAERGSLERALEVLEYMMGEKYAELAVDESRDVYTAFDDLDIREDRLFYEYADHIRRGFLQPWYYGFFEEATIIETGRELSSYMANEYRKRGWSTDNVHRINYVFNDAATFDSAIGMLRNSLHAQMDDYLGWSEERIESSGIARMTAIAGALALQEELGDIEVSVGLMPYASDIDELQPWKAVAVQNAKAYPGALQKGYSYVFEPCGCTELVGVRLTGGRIREIVAGGYDPSDYFTDPATGESTFDSARYGPYPYACETKGGAALEDDREYVVALSPNTLEKKVYEELLAEGRVIASGGRLRSANLARGIDLYFDMHPTISNANIRWE